MLKKGQPVSLSKRGTSMEIVHSAIRDGTHSREMLIRQTPLKPNQVVAALTNLTFIGMIVLVETTAGKRYFLPSQTPEPKQDGSKNSFRVQKNKGGRPKKPELQKRIYITPTTKEAREAFYRMGGSRWINRLLEGLA